MSLYGGSKTKVRVGSGLSEEFRVRVGVHQGSVISPLIFAIQIVREGVRAIAEGMRYIRPPLNTRGKTGLKLDDDVAAVAIDDGHRLLQQILVCW